MNYELEGKLAQIRKEGGYNYNDFVELSEAKFGASYSEMVRYCCSLLLSAHIFTTAVTYWYIYTLRVCIRDRWESSLSNIYIRTLRSASVWTARATLTCAPSRQTSGSVWRSGLATCSSYPPAYTTASRSTLRYSLLYLSLFCPFH